MHMTLKKMLSVCMVLALLLAMLVGCGSKNSETKPAETPETAAPADGNGEESGGAAEGEQAQSEAAEGGQAQNEASEQSGQTEPEEDPVPAPGSVSYDWLGLQDMPKCAYLDQLATNHYIQVYETYVLGVHAEVTEAIDGINAFQKNQASLTYSLDGTLFSIDENTKSYMQYEMTIPVDEAKANIAEAMREGTNVKARVYQSSGSAAIPLYSDETGDDAEYEYYEYLTGNRENGSYVIERFFMKDGDVFAIYTQTHAGESELESTNVIKSMSVDIPAGTFTLPDLSDYTKTN